MTRVMFGFVLALAAGLAGASEIPPPAERGPDAFRALLEKDSARVAALVKAIGLKPEN